MVEDPEDELLMVVMSEGQRKIFADMVMAHFGSPMIQMTHANPTDPDSLATWMFMPSEPDPELIEEIASTLEQLDERHVRTRLTDD